MRLDTLAADARAYALGHPMTRVSQKAIKPMILSGGVAVALSLNH